MTNTQNHNHLCYFSDTILCGITPRQAAAEYAPDGTQCPECRTQADQVRARLAGLDAADSRFGMQV